MRILPADKQHEVAGSCTHFNLKKASRAITQDYDEVLAPTGLRVSQFTLLIASSMAGPSSISDLADRLAMDRTTLSRNLQPLERRGLVVLSRKEEDARARLVSITLEGETFLAKIYPYWEKAQRSVTEVLDAGSFREFLGTMHTLTEFGKHGE